MHDITYGIPSDEMREEYDWDTEIGRFCADSGLVCVVSLNEVLAYNPGFVNHKIRPWTTTWIEGFAGEVQFIEITSEGKPLRLEVYGYGLTTEWVGPLIFRSHLKGNDDWY